MTYLFVFGRTWLLFCPSLWLLFCFRHSTIQKRVSTSSTTSLCSLEDTTTQANGQRHHFARCDMQTQTRNLRIAAFSTRRRRILRASEGRAEGHLCSHWHRQRNIRHANCLPSWLGVTNSKDRDDLFCWRRGDAATMMMAMPWNHPLLLSSGASLSPRRCHRGDEDCLVC